MNKISTILISLYQSHMEKIIMGHKLYLLLFLCSLLYPDVVILYEDGGKSEKRFVGVTYIGTSKLGVHFKKPGRFGRYKNYLVNCDDVKSISEDNGKTISLDCMNFTHNEKVILEQAFCIYCEGNVEFDKNLPVCRICESKKEKNKLVGTTCHKCGKKHESSEEKPMCTICDIMY